MESHTVIATEYGHNIHFSSEDKNIVRLSVPNCSTTLDISSKKYFDKGFKHKLWYAFGWNDADVDVLLEYIRSPSKWEGVIELDKLKLIHEANRLKAIIGSSLCSTEGHSFKCSPELKILFCKKCGNTVVI